METWKNNLLDVFRRRNIFPYKKWNTILYEWFEEYQLVIGNNTDNVNVMIHSNVYESTELKIKLRHDKPFYAIMSYKSDDDMNPVLNIKTTTRFNAEKQLSRIFKSTSIDDANDKDFYDWNEVELSVMEEPALEKEYVFEYISIQLDKYLETRDQM